MIQFKVKVLIGKGELGKRNGILQSAVSIAPIFSGFLQAGIYNSLNGHAGLAGWRWLFGKCLSYSRYSEDLTGATVINGVISLPIAILAYFCLPDTPGTAKPNWLFSERVSSLPRIIETSLRLFLQELELARARMASVGRTPEGKPYSTKVILGYFLSWKTLLFTLIFSKYSP